MINSSSQPVADALMFRSAGLSYREIARRQGVHASTAYARVQKAMRQERHAQYESPADFRDLELSKLARLERTVLSLALQGDMAAARVVIRITEMRLKLMQIPTPTISDELVDEMIRQPPTAAAPPDDLFDESPIDPECHAHTECHAHVVRGHANAEECRVGARTHQEPASARPHPDHAERPPMESATLNAAETKGGCEHPPYGASARQEPRPPRDDARRAKDTRPLTSRELWDDACRILAMYAKPEGRTDQNTNPQRQRGTQPSSAAPEQKISPEHPTPAPSDDSLKSTNPNASNDLTSDHRQATPPVNPPNKAAKTEPDRTLAEQKPNRETKPNAESGQRERKQPANDANTRE